MTYALGIDVGTTFTAAGVWRRGRVETVPLGNRALAVPSVVLVREDGTLLVGEAAARRAVLEPTRIAREFKRRVGDRVPLVLGGQTFSAEDLLAQVAAWVVERVTERQGGPPREVVLTCPATWGTYRRRLVVDAVTGSGLAEVELLPEPVAAAIHYAAQERVPEGAVVGVYDLGGGTFDATVLRKTADGFEVGGPAQGDDRLGGVDLDQVVLDQVISRVGGAWRDLDLTDPATLRAVAQVRANVVEAKEALSSDVEAGVAVILPGVSTEVRLQRSDFEEAVHGPLMRTVETMQRAFEGADVAPGDVHRVLLVGGSSRIPLVAHLLSTHLGVPVALDAHPKFAVCLGAAAVAGAHLAPGASVDTVAIAPVPTQDLPPADTHALGDTADLQPASPEATDAMDAVAGPPTGGDGRGADAGVRDDAERTAAMRPVRDAPPGGEAAARGDVPPPAGTAPPDERPSRRRGLVLALAAVALAAAAAAAVAVLGGGGDPQQDAAAPTAAEIAPAPAPASPDGTASPGGASQPEGGSEPPDRLTPATAAEVLALTGPVAFERMVGDERRIEVLIPGVADPRPLAPSAAGEQFHPAVSPDGTQVAFVTTAGDTPVVEVVDLDDGSTRPVTDPDDGAAFEPAWSPDGARLAYGQETGTGRALRIVDLGTGAVSDVTSGAVTDRRPAWSPDGTHLAFHRNVNGDADVFTIGTAGGDLVRRTTGPGDELHPTWSPDGRRLAYAGATEGTQVIVVLDLTSGEETRLLPGRDEPHADPAWGRGDVIAFKSGERGAEDVIAAAADGSWVVPLIRGDDALLDPSLPAGSGADGVVGALGGAVSAPRRP